MIEELQNEVDSMLEMEIVRPSTIDMAKKKDRRGVDLGS